MAEEADTKPGPEQQHLSVIYIPGIFKKTTKGTTIKADMQNPRSVILAVIPATVDIATQEILEMAEEADIKPGPEQQHLST
jgi:hypothetical protein